MTDPAIIVARRVIAFGRARVTVSKFADDAVLLTVDGGGVVVDVHASSDDDLERLCCAIDDVSVGAATWPHVADRNCTIDPATGCCCECGAHHGDPCADCGGRGFHVEGCEVGR